MDVIADLQIHGRYSRATSNALSIDNLEKFARIKGVNLLGTGDFQHPLWAKEIKEKLTEDDNGILWTKNRFPFIWQTEISLIYTQGGKGRKVHHLIYSPNGDTAKQIREALSKKGRLDYDGRPIFGFSSIELVEMMMGISRDIEIIPAHAWTPWFSIFGSKSGFDSVEACFQEKAKHIHAIETGLSSDPPMNWRISALDKYTLVSNSDLHSFWPWRLGRECTVFDVPELSYNKIMEAIRTRKGLRETIEVDPNYGKYHIDGHRKCNVAFTPRESREHNNICPVCRQPLTIGVLYRIEELADRPVGFRPENAVPFRTLLPLSEVINIVTGSPVASKKVWAQYNQLIKEFGNEFNVMLQAKPDAMKSLVPEKVVKAIMKVRNNDVQIIPGYDGEYGRPVFDGSAGIPEKTPLKRGPQKGLGEFLK
ncbi:DNA helicase UvrD [Candidatus Woesearchaeota archaeon]|nr:DNA helicase UvrD [Candidatus Woesearchaeota archaeon]